MDLIPAPRPAPLPPVPQIAIPRQVLPEAPPWGQVLHSLHGRTMGTGWSLLCYGPSNLRLASVEAAVQARLDALVAELSHWESGSLLCRFNGLPAGEGLDLPADFATVIDAALQVAAISAGAFDPCMGALVQRWGFGPPGLPAAQARSPLQAWRELRWNASRRHLMQPGGLMLDFSAIAKGHAVDCISTLLAGLGLPHHLIEIGGELRGQGLKPEGQPWWVDVEPPAADCDLPALRIALHQLAVASSGDYRRFRFDEQGRRLSHTLDPRTGRPVAHGLALVSVLHESAMWADAWSTALMVLGPEQGLALAASQGLAARLVLREATGWRQLLSPTLQALLEDEA
ncbi:FAD:protein FMN transferase [Roseateles sp. DB2]|uniref:FAD:protein FMN transferase n=1 Tax=Roseateles sp. DB2 TaxID=3453717 RepID=UPI003EEDBD21